MLSALRKIRNGSGVIIPKPMLAEIGSSTGDAIDIAVHSGGIVITPVRAGPRAGWAEDAMGIAAAGDDALVSPESANADDGDLTW